MGFVSYSVDNDKRFAGALARAREATEDLRIPLRLIAADFYRSQAPIFQLKGPGQYPDLAESTKKRKAKQVGQIYPILVGVTGNLFRAASFQGAPGNVTEFIGKNNMQLGVDGTAVPYAIYHQSSAARKKIPLRKFLFIGPEARQFADSDQVGRLERWNNILNSYVLQIMKKQGFDVGDL